MAVLYNECCCGVWLQEEYETCMECLHACLSLTKLRSEFSLTPGACTSALHEPRAGWSRAAVLQVPAATAKLPPHLWASRIRRTALCDFLTRSFASAVSSAGAVRPLRYKTLYNHICMDIGSDAQRCACSGPAPGCLGKCMGCASGQ